jgi:sigma-54 dependent transcriptional regulator, acetoin dehydrogenase operon transcriptional activator AcoR
MLRVVAENADDPFFQSAKEHLSEVALEFERAARRDEHYQLTLDQLGVSSLLVDAERVVRFACSSTPQLLGLSSADLIGRDLRSVLQTSQAEFLRICQLLNSGTPELQRIPICLTRGQSGSRWIDCEVRVDPRDRSRRLLLLHRSPAKVERATLREVTAKPIEMVGESPALARILAEVDRLGRGSWPVLIGGETGTGKELVARAIHVASDRHAKPFVTINCADLTESLLSSQLFGHRKGTFTGAIANQEGIFSAAEGGTLFLDEIGDMPLSIQVRLLRVLEQGEMLRIGENTPKKIDVRILVATHRDLVDDVTTGRFRKDLLYRIRVGRIKVPPLRERPEDIRLLVAHFLEHPERGSATRPTSIDDDALALLEKYSWPGNVRELRQAIEFAVIGTTQACIRPHDLPPEIMAPMPPSFVNLQPNASFSSLLRRKPISLRRIEAAIIQADGDRTMAAKILGISRSTLYRLFQRELDGGK